MIDHFLHDCRCDAQAVLDNFEYQQDLEFVPPQPIHPDTQGVATESAPSSPSPTILFRNSMGREYKIPLKQCRKWTVRDRHPRGQARRADSVCEGLQN